MNGPPDDKSKDELWNMYLLEVAGRDNDQKRHREDVKRVKEQSISDTIGKVLPAVDELERATAAAEKERGPGGLSRIRDGLGHTRRSVQKTLGKIGIEGFDSMGEDFDPQRMEALALKPVPDTEPGKVIEVFERGYTREGKMLRAARVVVSEKPEEEAS